MRSERKRFLFTFTLVLQAQTAVAPVRERQKFTCAVQEQFADRQFADRIVRPQDSLPKGYFADRTVRQQNGSATGQLAIRMKVYTTIKLELKAKLFRQGRANIE